MKHYGMFDPSVDPIIPGGFTKAHTNDLKERGFIETTLDAEAPDAIVAFRNSDLPGGVELRKVTVPVGTPILVHPETGNIYASSCGNTVVIEHIR